MLPVLFHLPGGHPVYAFGVMLGLALVVGFQLTVRLAHRDADMDRDVSGNACLAAVLAGVLGARLLYVLLNPEIMEDTSGKWWNIQSGGLMGAGGLLAGFAAVAVYLRVKRASPMAFADAAIPGLGLGVALTRLGSYLYGSDFGTRLSESAPGVLQALGTFPRWQDSPLYGSPAFAYHVQRYGLLRDAAEAYPVHPVQLYEALFGLVLLGFSLHLRRRRVFVGQAFLRFVMAYAVGTFLLAYLRADPDRGLLFDFSVSQLAAIAMLPAAVIAYGPLARSVPAAPAPKQAADRAPIADKG